jgi:hypothetical protein
MLNILRRFWTFLKSFFEKNEESKINPLGYFIGDEPDV